MSWGEIKKAINTDLTEPLNYLAYIDNIATFGNDGYVLNTESLVNELGAKSKNVLNDKIAFPLIRDAVFAYNSNVGGFFTNYTDDITGVYQDLNSIQSIVLNNTAISTLIDDLEALSLIANNDLFIGSCASNANARLLFASNAASLSLVNEEEILMTAIANDVNCLEVIFNSWGAKEAMWDGIASSEALMNSANISRQYMIDNYQVRGSIAPAASTWSEITTKKVFVLGYEGAPAMATYRFIQPGNLTSSQTDAYLEQSARVKPLQIHNSSGYIAATVDYVLMQE